MPAEQPLEIRSDELTLSAVLRTPVIAPWPLVILCHGLLSHKDSSKYRQLAQELAAKGIASLRFDFRGCGASEGRLEESSVSGRWRDLRRISEHARGLRHFNGRLGLLGSSLGGYLALLEAGSNRTVCCLVVWSTPSHLHILEQRLPQVTEVDMDPTFYQDLQRYRRSLETKVDKLLLIHGEDDRLVPPEHAHRLFSVAAEPKDLHVLPDADHRFSEAAAREQAVQLSLKWFQRFLQETP